MIPLSSIKLVLVRLDGCQLRTLYLGPPLELAPRLQVSTLHDGTSPSLIDALNIEHTGSARNTENSSRNQLGNFCAHRFDLIFIQLQKDQLYIEVGMRH